MFLMVGVSTALSSSDNVTYTSLLSRETQAFLLSQTVIFAVKIGFTRNVLMLHAIPYEEKIPTTSCVLS